MKSAKHENITLSFPRELNVLLHIKVPSRCISRYVADAVRKALAEDDQKQLSKLEAAYEQANQDSARLKTIDEWKVLDGLDDTAEWEWD